MTDITGRIYLNRLPNIAWKGKTFNQITSSLQKNSKSAIFSDTSTSNIFRAMPVEQYRKEIDIQTVAHPTCSKRMVSIDELNMPNGYILTSDPTSAPNLVNTLDFNLSNSPYDRPNACSTLNNLNGTTANNCLNQQFNALRRCRSAGMIKKSFNANNVNNYFTDTSQYLTGRSKTFEQNQYNYIVSGNNAAIAGSPAAANNVYRPQGQTDCSGGIHISYKPNNAQYAQQGAVDSSARTIRAKYNRITTNAGIFYSTLGSAAGNAMAYDGSDTVPYTVKSKMAFPNKAVPKINKYTGEMVACQHNVIRM